jgi:hypothetical protein
VVPPLLLNQPETPEERGHRVKFGLGAGVEPELHAPFEQRFGFPLVEVWGMTETGRIYADHREPRQVTTRAFGRPFGGLEARVVDDGDREVARGGEGELLVRWGGPEGPRHGFFAGYLKNAEATAEAWRGGWFHTGDVARQADDGMLYFVDRKKNIIRRSGENIAAAEIEATLQAHDAVAQVAVLAVPDEIREEEVMACVVPMAGVTPDGALAARLVEWCLERPRVLQGAGLDPVRRFAADHGDAEGPEDADLPARRGPAATSGRRRSPRAEEAPRAVGVDDRPFHAHARRAAGAAPVHGIERVMDVRRFPRSRRHPHVNADALARDLPAAGLAYRHLPGLGGFRRPRKDSRNTGWRNASFRGYADYMETDEFAGHLATLLDEACAGRTAIMCAEAVPWRCHRSLISDALLARGVAVRHILGEAPAQRTR